MAISPLFIECSLTLFLSLTLHLIFSCLIKSYQIEIYRISVTRQLVWSLSVKVTKQGPILWEKKSNHSNNNNDNDDKDTIMTLLSSTIIFYFIEVTLPAGGGKYEGC